MMAGKTEPGEFEAEEAIVLTDPLDEKEFDDGVSASFIRFDDKREDDAQEKKEK